MNAVVDLNKNTFLIFAAKAYDKPNCIQSEFEEDLHRLKYVTRLIKKYTGTGDLRERLILNHIIILTNVFGVELAVRMLFYKVPEDSWAALKTFLIFLNFMPNVVRSIRGQSILSSDILVDIELAKVLRTI
jgi:hypothetical protein